MNKDRRKELERAKGLLDEARTIIETEAQGEREYFDNMSENFQNADKGTKADETATALEEMVESIGEHVDAIDEAVAS